MAQRYFVDDLPDSGSLSLPPEVAHHLGRVLRMAVGESVILGDGRGRTAEARLTAVHKDRVEAIVEQVASTPPVSPRVHVAFAPPRLQRAEWLFEHGTEVGVAVFHPLWTTRTRPQGERPERWQKIVVAAAGQCDRPWLPRIEPALELQAFLQRRDLPSQRLVGTPGGTRRQALVPADEWLLLVGPEGGFTAAEQATVLAAGFQPLGLGPHVLRTETAALVGAALLLAT